MVSPVAVYLNADTQKKDIIQQNRNKSGVYQWINNTNGNSYIGSSINLNKRLLEYFNTRYLLRKNYMTICKALVKYGYSEFTLVIIEYCEPENCIEREQYYIDTLKPEYNILHFAGSNKGFKHSEETLATLKNPSAEVRALASARMKELWKDPSFGGSRKGSNHPMYGKAKPEGSGRASQIIKVLDVTTNVTTEYNSFGEAALALNIKPARISMYLSNHQKTPYKGRYIFIKR